MATKQTGDLLEQYRQVFSHHSMEMAKSMQTSLLGYFKLTGGISDRKFEELIAPNKPFKFRFQECIRFVKDTDNLDVYRKFSASFIRFSREEAFRFFPFLKDLPTAIHPTYEIYEARSKKRRRQPVDVLVLVTTLVDFESLGCALHKTCLLKKQRLTDFHSPGDGDCLWGDMEIYEIKISRNATKSLALVNIWSVEYMDKLLNEYTSHVSILCSSTALKEPVLLPTGEFIRSGSVLLYQSIETDTPGDDLKAHERINELKLWNLLKWRQKCQPSSENTYLGSNEEGSTRGIMRLLAQNLETIKLEKNDENVSPLLTVPVKACRLEMPTLHFVGTRDVPLNDSSRAASSFYNCAAKRRPDIKGSPQDDASVYMYLSICTLMDLKKEPLLNKKDAAVVVDFLLKIVQYFSLCKC